MKYRVRLLGLPIVLVLLAALVMFSGCNVKPVPKPTIKGDLVIVSHTGEVTEEVRCAGEGIQYRINYQNNTSKPADIYIADPLPEGLVKVIPSDRGEYDRRGHLVKWRVGKVAPGDGGFVEVTAIVGAAKVLRNQATIEMEGLRPITTNTVETIVCAPPDLGWIPFDGKAKPGKPSAYMKDQTTMGVTVNFDIPGMFAYEKRVDDVLYHRLAVPGRAALADVGEPELPIVGQIIEVPYDVKFEIEIIKEDSIRLDGYNVYPAQELWDKEGAVTPFTVDKSIYQANKVLPGELATITAEDIGVMRGHRVVFLKANPVQYNPFTREAELYNQIEVRLNYDRPAQVEPIDSRLLSPAFEETVVRSVVNYLDQERFDTNGGVYEPGGADYLILTHGDFYTAGDATNPVVQLANWKRQKGHYTRVVDIDDIPAGQTAADIKDYLQNAYDNWYPPPTYVLLVGDAEFIPTHYETQHPFGDYNNAETGTDLYYATLDGTDYFPDLFIGRLPVDTLQEATAVISKTINYEQNPPENANFYTDATLIALFEDITSAPPPPDTEPEDGTEDRPWITNVEEVRAYLEDQGYNTERIYATSSGFPGDPWSSQPQNFENGDPLPTELTVAGDPANGIPGFPWDGDAGDINTAITNGVFLVTYRDHGNRGAWSRPFEFDRWDATGLANGAMTPVVISLACETAWFDNETDDDATLAGAATGNNAESFGEHFIRNANGGTVAFISATRVSTTGWNDFLMFGYHQAIWPNFDPAPGLLAGYPAIPDIESGRLRRMGQVLSFGKTYMANAYTASDVRLRHFEMYHLFGDPEMPIWVQQPGELDVEHPEGIGATGVQDFVVKVTDTATSDPVNSAVVALTRDDQLLAVRQTNPGGFARFTLNSMGDGEVQITVTLLDYRPYQGVILVNDGGALLNRLEPEDGPENQVVMVGGQNFSGDEQVEIYLGDQLLNTATAAADSFGQSGVDDVDIQVPSSYELGPVNVVAHGQDSERYASDVFYVRTANPIDLYTYSQWDSSTFGMTPGDDPTWNNPEIQFYDMGGNPVASNNLDVGSDYDVKATVYNDTDFDANDGKVTFRWANFGVAQPDRVWEEADTSPATLDVLAHDSTEAEIRWAPPSTGHLCMLVEIYHVEDINTDNNRGQENLHIGPTSSPAEVPFVVYNPTKKPLALHLEVRQLVTPGEQERLWGTWVKHPDPQVIEPGEAAEAMVIIDPKWADVDQGVQAEFALTAFIDGKVAGGVNFIIVNR